MPVAVSDPRSNPNDQIAHAARVIGRSEHKRKVFEAIHYGKKPIKTVPEIANWTGLTAKQVLDAAKKLVHAQLVEQIRSDGETAYKKDGFYSANKQKILGLAGNPDRLSSFPTKTNPRSSAKPVVLYLPRSFIKVRRITVDDIREFRRVRSTERRGASATTARAVPEARIKSGIKSLLGSAHTSKDWGGEKCDLCGDIHIGPKRLTAAFALKGPGTTGKLVPGKMGTNGDQVQRLFSVPADVYIIQYVGEIDESLPALMVQLAQARSATTGTEMLYGVVDGVDTARLIDRYPEHFRTRALGGRA